MGIKGEIMHKVIIEIDDSENQDGKPPFHTKFVQISGFKYLKKEIKEKIIKDLKELI